MKKIGDGEDVEMISWQQQQDMLVAGKNHHHLHQLPNNSCKQVGVKIEVEVSSTDQESAKNCKSEAVLNFCNNVPSSPPPKDTMNPILKLDDAAMEELFSTMYNPLLFQQLAVKLESSCLTEDYNLFVAHWDDSSPTMFPWCD